MKNIKAEHIIIAGISAIALYLIWKGKKPKAVEETSNAGGTNSTSCWSVGLQGGQDCQDACEDAGGTYDGTYNGGQGGCVGHSPTFEGSDKKARLTREYKSSASGSGAYTTTSGRKVCYNISPRGQMITVPCP